MEKYAEVISFNKGITRTTIVIVTITSAQASHLLPGILVNDVTTAAKKMAAVLNVSPPTWVKALAILRLNELAAALCSSFSGAGPSCSLVSCSIASSFLNTSSLLLKNAQLDTAST